jgi:EthD domain
MITAMPDTVLLTFRRPPDEPADAFGARLRGAAERVAASPATRTVILFVDDGDVGAPGDATALAPSFDGALLVEGDGIDRHVEAEADGTAQVLAVSERRVMKGRDRGTGGVRSEGFTVLCPSVRAPALSHDEFDAHWRDRHAPIHVASSPGTCHYEHLVLEPGAGVAWDGVGLLSFATATDFTERMFDGEAGLQAIYDDIPRFLELEAGETLPASEFVYKDAR